MIKERFNTDWYFARFHKPAELKKIDLPYDAMWHEKRVPNLSSGAFSAYFPGGKYTYSKKILANDWAKYGTLWLEFEGVYGKTEVFLDDVKIGQHIYGYTNFYVELSGKLKAGKEHLLKVVVDNTQVQNSRWYTGSGIYRNVNLYYATQDFILPHGVKITTKSIDPALIDVEVEACKKESTEVETTIFRNGKAVVRAKGEKCSIEIPDAYLWSAAEPNLYTAEVNLVKDGEVIDSSRQEFGIRTLDWNASGFYVNGERIKLRGGSVHHDNGLLGACSYKDAEFRRVKKLKDLGFNALRYGHAPANHDFLQACDQLGMFVINESFDSWKTAKTEYDYSLYFSDEWRNDIDALIKVSYNHPSVIMYSTGNEIPLTGKREGAELMREMHLYIKEQDATRATTHSFNMLVSLMGAFGVRLHSKRKKSDKVDPNRKRKKMAATASVLANLVASAIPWLMQILATPKRSERIAGNSFDAIDIIGLNYGSHLFEKLHELNPNRLIYGSESYPREFSENWKKVELLDHLIGDFMWTAWDYLGEAGAGVPAYSKKEAGYFKPYPCLTAGVGAVDILGKAEAQAEFAAIVWGHRKEPFIGVKPILKKGEKRYLGQWRGTDAIASWDWPGCEDQQAEIEVYSPGEKVILCLNDIEVGRSKLDKGRAFFEIPYQVGVLKAYTLNRNEEEVGYTTLRTPAKAHNLELKLDNKEFSRELLYIFITAVDKSGEWVRSFGEDITIKVEGDAEILTLGSSNPFNEQGYFSTTHQMYHGKALLILKKAKCFDRVVIYASAEAGVIGELTVT